MAMASPQRPNPSTDAELVLRAQAGDRQAFGELHGRTARLVHAILLARGSAQEADDLVQDVFVVALSKLHTLDDPARFSPWLCAIARNKAKDLGRRRTVIPLPETLEATRRPRSEAAQMLRHMQALPDTYAETLVMRLVEGMTGPEIAQRTGMTPGSVRVNLHRGMKLLRERLETP